MSFIFFFIIKLMQFIYFFIFVRRFAIKDLIDLRKCRWTPRRQDLNPKTMGQIQKEQEVEHRHNDVS